MAPLTASEALMASRIAIAIIVDLIAGSALSGRGRVGPWCREVLPLATMGWSAYVIHDVGRTTVHCLAIRCVVGRRAMARRPGRAATSLAPAHAGSARSASAVSGK